MAGPGAQYSPFGQTLNLVLHFQPNLAFFPGASAEVQDVLGGGRAAADYNRAVIQAGMKVARAPRTHRPGRAARPTETFALPPVTRRCSK